MRTPCTFHVTVSPIRSRSSRATPSSIDTSGSDAVSALALNHFPVVICSEPTSESRYVDRYSRRSGHADRRPRRPSGAAAVSASKSATERPLIAATRIGTSGACCTIWNPVPRMIESIPAAWSSCTSKKTRFARACARRKSRVRSRLWWT